MQNFQQAAASSPNNFSQLRMPSMEGIERHLNPGMGNFKERQERAAQYFEAQIGAIGIGIAEEKGKKCWEVLIQKWPENLTVEEIQKFIDDNQIVEGMYVKYHLIGEIKPEIPL